MKNLTIFTGALIFMSLLLNYANADIKVNIVNNENNRQFAAEFDTQQKADTWIEKNLSNDSWGKKERWVLKTDQANCLEEREIVSEMFEQTRQQKGQMESRVECKLAKEYTITQVDITKEVKAKKAKKNASNASTIDILVKIKDGSAKTKDLVDYLRIKEGL